MADISKIIFPSGKKYNIKDTIARTGSNIYIVKGTQTTTTGAWTGNINIDALYDGLTISYYLPRPGSGNASLDLTLKNGTTTGAVPVYATSTTRATTHYGAGSTIILTYWSAGSISVNGTSTTQNRWTSADITDLGSMTGTLSPGKGGTGLSVSSTTDLTTALMNSLNIATGVPNDDTYYISQNTNAGYNTYYRRPASKIWEYIKGKISSWMKNKTAVGSLDWTSASNDTMPITSNTLAYWNGAYRDNSSNLSHLGTVTSGVWNGSTIGVDHGGTGATTLTSGALLQGNGTNSVSAASSKGSSNSPIYIDSSGKPQTITSFPQSNLQWGGKNFSASYGCIDAALDSNLGANRFAFIKDGITVQYSRDNGTTWIDYGASDLEKRKIFGPDNQWPNIYIGKANSNSHATTDYQLRVTVDTGLAHIYTALNKFIFYIFSGGSNGLRVTIQRALQSTPDNYTNIATNAVISGWSGYNVVNTTVTTTYGNDASSQYGRIRFIFSQTAATSGDNVGMLLISIKAFGGVGWNTPSTLARTGHLYSYDTLMNATFPANLQANGTINSNNINAEGELTANSAVLGNVIVNGDTTFNNGLRGNLTGQVNNFAVSNVTMNTFGRCSTAAATSVKEVTVTTPFALVDGARITVLFDNQNTNATPYLNVNNTGANSIWLKWQQITSDNNNIGVLHGAIQMVFVTDRWHIIG